MLIGDTEHFRRISGPPLVKAQVKRFHDMDCRASRPAVQAPDGSCDWSELRPYVDWLVANGMVGVQVLGGTPEHDTDSAALDGYGRKGGRGVPRTWAKYRQCWRSFCDTFSAAEVPYISTWNEPNGPRSFDGDVSDLIKMHRIAREEAPDRIILTPSFYNIEHARPFLKACPRDLWDLLDLHLYGQDADMLARTLDEYRRMLPGVRFALTETGWQCNDQTGPGWKWPGMTRRQRADEWLKVCRMCDAAGDVDLLMWYSLDAHTKLREPVPPIDKQPVYSMGDKPELLAAQKAAVERTPMATTTNPSPTQLIAAAISSLLDALSQTTTQTNAALTLLGQVRAYLTTVLAAGGGGGTIDPNELQGILDMLSQAEEDMRALSAQAQAAVAANQLPSTSPAPAVGAAVKG